MLTWQAGETADAKAAVVIFSTEILAAVMEGFQFCFSTNGTG